MNIDFVKIYLNMEKTTREDALKYVIEERTDWLKLEAVHSRDNIAKLWEAISDIDVIRQRANWVPDMLTTQNLFKGEFDEETRKYLSELQARLPVDRINDLNEIAMLKKWVAGALVAGGLSVLGHVARFFV